MATSTTPTTRKKDPAYFKVADGKYAEVKLRKSSFSGALATELGIEWTLPGGAAVIALGKAASVVAGCFPIILEYEVRDGITQTTRVLCAPTKADTIGQGAMGKTYNGKPIKAVRAPRRRVFVV